MIGARLLWPGLLALGLLAGCRAGTLRRPPDSAGREAPAGVLSLRWRTVVHEHALFEPRPQECAVGALVGNRLVVGTRDGRVLALSKRDGRKLWSAEVGGEIDAPAVYDAQHDQVLVGADDGTLYAIEPGNGRIKWRYKGQGAIEEAAEVWQDLVFVATTTDKLYAISAVDGAHRWEYDRDRPEGFTIHGYAAPRVHDGVLYAGFSDGSLVALKAEDGEVMWARSLAAAADQFVDVDTAPAFVEDGVLAASYSGGLYALSRDDGHVLWRLPVEGAARATLADGRFFFVTPRVGLHAVDPQNGQVLWRRALPEAGEVSKPAAIGPYLVVSGNDSGVYVIERATGQLLQTFVPGRGMCAAAAVDAEAGAIYVLSNGGTMYGLALR